MENKVQMESVKQLHTICSLHSLYVSILPDDPVMEYEETDTSLGLFAHPWAERLWVKREIDALLSYIFSYQQCFSKNVDKHWLQV